MRTITRKQNVNSQILEQLLLAIFSGFIFFLVFAAVFLLGYQIFFIGRVYPGTSVAGVELGGKSPEEASQLLFEELTYTSSGRVLFTDNENTYLYSPADLGLFLNTEQSAQNAFSIGREGTLAERIYDQFSARFSGRELTPVYILDPNFAYQRLVVLSEQLYVPVIEPSLSISGTNVVVHPGQGGRELDVETTLELLKNELYQTKDSIIPLVIKSREPEIVDVSRQAEMAQKIINETLIISMPDSSIEENLGPWEISPVSLASMLSFETIKTETGTDYQVTIDTQLLSNFLRNIETAVYREAKNARFMFDDESGQLEVIEPAVIGHSLNISASVVTIQQKLTEGSHQAALVLEENLPAVTDDKTGEELGIRELVHEEVSYFYGSSAERIQNIQAAADSFYGVLIAPGEVFSMADTMGDISLDNGYAEALIIVGGETITGIGGGVCQVSTTLFRAAFFAGFPIVERHSHAYRVSYYEKVAGNRRDESLAGLDATVYVPVVDFKFINDTPNWLLMETYVNPSYSSIIWKFYSTSDGRTVDWTTTGPINTVEPEKPLYRENSELEEGEIKQVDWEAEGSDVTVERTVYLDGDTHLHDTFYTHYEPWQAIYEYGPGTELPEEALSEDEEKNEE